MNFPLILSVLAASATLVGGFFATLPSKPSGRLIALSLAFAAGIMLMIALTEMLPAVMSSGGKHMLYGYLAFVFGLVSFYVINGCLAHEHPADLNRELLLEPSQTALSPQRLQKTAMLLTVGITLHNFPEGLATFISATHDLELGMGVALAVSIHNLPEGLAVAAPVYLATGSKIKALFWAGISGFAELLGGFLAFLFWNNSFSAISLDIIMAGVAGIMVAISIDELLPLAKEIHADTNPSIGIFTGMAVMGLSMVLLRISSLS